MCEKMNELRLQVRELQAALSFSPKKFWFHNPWLFLACSHIFVAVTICFIEDYLFEIMTDFQKGSKYNTVQRTTFSWII